MDTNFLYVHFANNKIRERPFKIDIVYLPTPKTFGIRCHRFEENCKDAVLCSNIVYIMN